jgi:tripartite ATP-independent transporter DctM subunit
LIEITGMARAMVGFLAALLGHVKGGLYYVLLSAMYLVSGISGAKAADMAAIVPVLFPEMKRRGSKPGELIGVLASSAAMAETIPPSLVLIALGSVAGVSIAALFAAGFLPALVLAVVLGLLARYRSRNDDMSGIQRASISVIGWAFVVAIPALLLPLLIRTLVAEGVTTATEVSTVGILYALVLGLLLYRKLELRALYGALVSTASLSGAILLIVGAASAMAWALSQSGFSRDIVSMVVNMPGGRISFLLASIVLFVVLGSILEGLPALILFAPLLFPAARAIGIHDVHYSMIVVLAMGVGLFSPPFGVGFYIACAIGKINPDRAMGSIWLYMAALIIGLLLITFFPAISLVFV